MDRNSCVVGFLGMDKYEYIMYLSRVLHHLGKKILIVDSSETGALTYGVPCPKGIKNSVFEYRGLMFLNSRQSKEKDLYWGNETDTQNILYDCVMIDYGFTTEANDLEHCDSLVCVTDQQAHNIRRLSGLCHMKNKKINLIIKNFVSSTITPKYIVNELNLGNQSVRQTYVVYHDELDTKCKLNCQYDERFRFIRLSTQSKNVIKGLTAELFPEVTKKEIEAAYKKAERGI